MNGCVWEPPMFLWSVTDELFAHEMTGQKKLVALKHETVLFRLKMKFDLNLT